MTKPTHIAFNVLLTPDQHESLRQLADRLTISRGQVLRYALAQYFTMVCRNVPTCANGQRCYVPQMHPPAIPIVDITGQTTVPAAAFTQPTPYSGPPRAA